MQYIIAYVPVFLIILDTVIMIITQLNRRFPYVPNLIREVTALRWYVWSNSFKLNTTLYIVESATETVENSI